LRYGPAASDRIARSPGTNLPPVLVASCQALLDLARGPKNSVTLPGRVPQATHACRKDTIAANTLHWCLDVTFREEESRVRNRTLADNVAWLKRFAISLLKQVEDKESIAMRRRMAGSNPAYLFKPVFYSLKKEVLA